MDSGQRRALRLAGRAYRPQVRVEAVLEAGDGLQIGPDGAVEDRADSGVIDAGESRGGAQAAAGQSTGQVEGEPTCRFDVGLVAGGVGPAGKSRGGGLASRARHGINIGAAGGRLRLVPQPDNVFVGTPLQTGGSNQQQGGDPVATAIAHYTPELAPEQWAQIAEFVRAAVTDAHQGTVYSARELLKAATPLVAWCFWTAGLDLDRETVFHPEVIGEFIDRGTPQWSRPTAANRRSQLLRMSELLLPHGVRPVRLPPMWSARPSVPYTPAEVIALRSWAGGQTSQYMVVNSTVLLALGLGAGLSAAEVCEVRAGHLLVDADGVLVEVVGKRSRLVPVLAEWEPILVSLADAAAIRPDLYVFRPQRTTSNKNTISNFVAKTNAPRVHPSLLRMRATWIVTHLTAGSPVKPLMEAAGVESLEALTRYLQFVPDVDVAAYRAAFRDAQKGGQA